MSRVEERSGEMEVALPNLPTPIARYVPGERAGNLVFTAGQVSAVEGRAYKGNLGATLSIEGGLRECREHGWRLQRVEQARVPSRGENGRNGVTVRHAYTLMHTT